MHHLQFAIPEEVEEIDHTYSNVVGQDELTRFDKFGNKKRKKRRNLGHQTQSKARASKAKAGIQKKQGNQKQGDQKQGRNKNRRRKNRKRQTRLNSHDLFVGISCSAIAVFSVVL